MNKIAKYLNQHIIGNVFDSPQILEAYSTDYSPLKITPQMVVIPECTSDVCKTVKFVNQLTNKSVYMPIAIRGSGLDKTGADLGDGMILSTEHLNKILEIDDRSRLVRVQAGVTVGQLNSALALYGLTLPIVADSSETIGSLIANFATDSAAGKYNGIFYYVDQIEAVLSSGETIQTSRISRPHLSLKTGLTSFEGEIYKKIDKLISDNQELITELSNRTTVDAAGYQMITQVVRDTTRSFDLLPLFYASQGTLGIITEVILRCEIFQPDISHFIAAFESIGAAQDFIQDIMPLIPEELNLYDARMFKTAIKHGKDPGLFAPKFYKGYFVWAGFDDKPRVAEKKLKKCLKLLPNNAAAVTETEENTMDFKRLESAILSYLNDDISGERTPLMDNFYVPSDKLTNFLTDLKNLEKTYDQELPVYGSFSTSNYSVRPDIQLNTVEGRQFVLRFIEDFDSLVREHGGSITGGAPEGRLKALSTNATLGDLEFNLYHSIKEVFDPKAIFNPGIKLSANETDIVRHIRTSYLDKVMI